MVPQQSLYSSTDSLKLTDSPFLRACCLKKNSYTPIWLMRQAGRYMAEYRAMRAKLGFLELCKKPEAAAEVTVVAAEKLAVDAAIIFADILLILEPLGVGLKFSEGDGPLIQSPLRSKADLDSLKTVDVEADLAFVYEAIRQARAALKPDLPLIGFAGAPFTLASYLIEGGSSRNFERTKLFIYSQPGEWQRLISLLAQLTEQYLKAQIKAGVQAVQLFDSWAGCLSAEDYRQYVLPSISRIVAAIDGSVPIIYFATGASHLLPAMQKLKAQVLGLDWRVDLASEWSRLGHRTAVQGNLDPAVLLAGKDEIKRRVERILAGAEGRPGHIFNLGHGVLPETPVDNVRFLVEVVHQLSAR
ncbi:MAG: uroporphyrinogen decarboxylase [Candidatus Melainabacteria bacterium]|nr:MAG: uroporphyrinogen decarboxylase [Candidatus Melainabacteria bacterium]